MAKPNKMAEEAEAEQMAKGIRPPIMTTEAWDAVETPEYGGQADIMELGVDEIGGPFTYVGAQPMQLESNKAPITVHIGTTEEGVNLRLPIASSFLRAMDQSKVKPGDTFATKRTADVQKKSGVGKGTTMQIFSVKVLSRAASGPSA